MPSDILLRQCYAYSNQATSPNPYKLFKVFHYPVPKIQMYELIRVILIQLTQTLEIMSTAGSFIQQWGEPPSSAQAAFDISWLSLLD